MSNKITFGDWSSDGYLFKQDDFMKSFNEIPFNIEKNDYMKYFGNYNSDKNRFSWSGKCIPKYDTWNYNGTNLIFDSNNNLYIIYSYMNDIRNLLIPELFKRKKYIILQYWKYETLKHKIETKFNKKGFILFEKNKNNVYYKLSIGSNINIETFIKLIKKKDVFFDSGMYQGNIRNYSHFRSSNKIWKKLIIEEYI